MAASELGRKVLMVDQGLDMQNPISVWQCLQIRKYGLEELVDKVRDLYRSGAGMGRKPAATGLA